MELTARQILCISKNIIIIRAQLIVPTYETESNTLTLKHPKVLLLFAVFLTNQHFSDP